MNTTRHFHAIDLSVTLKTPWLVHGNDPGRFGLDATQMRDHNGIPILPGSLIVGRIRASWDEMDKLNLGMPSATEWFGIGAPEGDGRTRIWVEDLAAQDRGGELLLMTRVHIDDDTGAGQNGMLMMAEQTHKLGSEIVFSGKWRACLANSEVEPLKHNLLAGMLWHSQFGAQRSVGFGELLAASVEIRRADSGDVVVPAGDTARLTLNFDCPICVATRNRRGNVFESSDIVTGGTIKGAMTAMISARTNRIVAANREVSKLAEHFDAIRISHAFPSSGGKRPAAVPMSLVAVNGQILDIAELDRPHLIDGHAPAFMHDWKGDTWDEVNRRREWGDTGDHLRVRTKIDAVTRAAEDGMLFAYQSKVAGKNVAWLADVSLAKVPQQDRAAVWRELGELLGYGLGPVGKTDAFAKAKLDADCVSVWQQSDASASNRLSMMLNTPALLLASTEVADSIIDLRQLYTKAFDELSGSALRLSHFYAGQSMAGGTFLQMRFTGKMNEQRYLPFVLTDAGSIFVLEMAQGREEQAKTILSDWQANGLPLPSAVRDERGGEWHHHPYLPENGFGEITINLAHGFAAPQESRLTPC